MLLQADVFTAVLAAVFMDSGSDSLVAAKKVYKISGVCDNNHNSSSSSSNQTAQVLSAVQAAAVDSQSPASHGQVTTPHTQHSDDIDIVD